jgi:hypothetical protein
MYVNVVLQLNAPGAVELDLFQGLAHDIVWLVLRGLDVLDGRVLVEVALVVDVELAEGILQRKYVALLELRVLSRPWSAVCRRPREGFTCRWSLMTFMIAGRRGESQAVDRPRKRLD